MARKTESKNRQSARFGAGRIAWGCLVAVALLAVAELFLPESGASALLSAAVQATMFWMIALYTMFRASERVGRYVVVFRIIAVLLVILAVWTTTSLLRDATQGPVTISLHSVSVTEQQSLRSLLRRSYVLEGRDEQGEAVQLLLSRADAEMLMRDISSLSTAQPLQIRYYERTRRFHSLLPVD